MFAYAAARRAEHNTVEGRVRDSGTSTRACQPRKSSVSVARYLNGRSESARLLV